MPLSFADALTQDAGADAASAAGGAGGASGAVRSSCAGIGAGHCRLQTRAERNKEKMEEEQKGRRSRKMAPSQRDVDFSITCV